MAYYELTYIYHDCFVLETERAVIIFDYWKDPLSGENRDYPPLLNLIDGSKSVYMIVSHHHKDHFSRRIFLWSEHFPSMRYIISKDVYRAVKYMFREETTYAGFRPSSDTVFVLSEGETYEDSVVRVIAFGSTDIGNSYVVETGGRKFFHAGDLNAWIWKDESSQKEVDEAIGLYMKKLGPIRTLYPHLDVAMFPVDSRLGTDYFLGAKILVREIKVDLFIPMHFELVEAEEDKDVRRMDAARFSLYANPLHGEYVQLAATRSRFRKNYD